jgi:hypothetical protein
MKLPAPDSTNLRLFFYYGELREVRDSLRREIVPRELFADVRVELICDRVRVERPLFRNIAGIVSPRRNRCRSCRAREYVGSPFSLGAVDSV